MTPEARERKREYERSPEYRVKRRRWRTTQRTLGPNGELRSKTQRPEPTLVPQEVPGPATIKFATTVYDREGKPDRQFVRVEPDKVAKEAAWRAMADELRKDLPRLDPIPAPAPLHHTSLLTVYPIGDHHLGMLSWPPETGAAYDMAIGEALLTNAMTNLVYRAPPSDTALIAVLGDFFHYDSFETITPKGRNLLDSDTRFPKMIAAGIRLIHRAISLALQKHQKVHVIIEIGNHDTSTSIFLALALADKYENERRVSVDISPRNCHFLVFGSVLIGTHHGDKIKLDDLPLIMATDRPADWGRTKWRYWLTGHVHHYQAKEIMGCVVESFGILAPSDAWGTQQGHRPARTMKAITYHKDYGEVDRMTVNPQMLE